VGSDAEPKAAQGWMTGPDERLSKGAAAMFLAFSTQGTSSSTRSMPPPPAPLSSSSGSAPTGVLYSCLPPWVGFEHP
jgi:hypothetical protein